ncbi:MFS transporter [Candidatus Leptofilum sp.]|uniref:MFS transporter n=1 Tax=Candidatus Leptofilum sp. TaxID=3241576 RepID=UPI003B58C3E2
MNNSKSLRPFFIIWSGQALSLVGSAAVQFALVWWLTQETGSATILATSSLVAFLPQVLLGPFAGVLVDRWSRRWTMFLADSVIALATLLLAYLFWIEAIEIWHIFALVFVRSLGSAFHGPAMQASTSLMVPHEHLTRIQGINQMLEGGLGIIGAPLGALLLATLPMQGILAIDVVTALFAIIPLLFIFVPQPEKSAEELATGQKESYWTQMRQGLAYVWAWPGILLLMLLAMLVNFVLTPVISLLPLLVSDYFGGGAWEFGLMQSTFGVGIIVGGLILGAWGGFKKRIYTSLMGLVGLGIGISLTGLAPANLYWLAVVGGFISGSMIAMVNGPVRAILQAAVAPDMQGRVMSLIGSLATAMTPIGLVLAGPLADQFGERPLFIIAGLATVLAGIAGFFIPALLTVEDGRSNTPPSPDEETSPEEMQPETGVSSA